MFERNLAARSIKILVFGISVDDCFVISIVVAGKFLSENIFLRSAMRGKRSIRGERKSESALLILRSGFFARQEIVKPKMQNLAPSDSVVLQRVAVETKGYRCLVFDDPYQQKDPLNQPLNGFLSVLSRSSRPPILAID